MEGRGTYCLSLLARTVSLQKHSYSIEVMVENCILLYFVVFYIFMEIADFADSIN